MKADAAPGNTPSRHTKADFENLGRVRAAGPRRAPFAEGLLPRICPRGRGFPGGASNSHPAGGGREKAPDPDRALPILREPPSRRLRPAEETRSPGRAQRRPRARLERLARRCRRRGSLELPAGSPARPSRPRVAHAQYISGSEPASARRAAGSRSALQVLAAAEARSIWSTAALEENWPVGPGGREREGRIEGRATRRVIKAAIKVGPKF